MENQIFNLSQTEQRSGAKKTIVLVLVIVLIIAAIAGGFYFWKKKAPEITKPVYKEIYRLVPEKISSSAAIVIFLPEGVNKSTAQKNIEFYPEIEGKWLKANNEREIIFKPQKPLKLNRYYSVALTMAQSEETVIKADFLAVEDPEIIAIFPKEGSETPEKSEITIVFNRPMVPLTTLGYLEEKDVPVEIIPATQGKFKWITTRNLQFIPEERLKRSSHYKVKIKSGMVSMDDLPLTGKETNFITRKLRYLNLSQGETTYNQPISIYFNQPVDLESTKKEITLKDLATGREIPFIAEYGQSEKEEVSKIEKDRSFGTINLDKLTAKVTGWLDDFGWSLFKKEEKEEKKVDKSFIQIYNETDRFQREKLWDFKHNYSLKINKAYPEEGDIILEEGRFVNIFVTDVIEDITAESERTAYAGPDFFDPQGKLWVTFYEEIDLNKSEIKIPKLKDIGYGEKCKDEDQTLYQNIDCQKVTDKKTIFITLKEEEIGPGERLEVNFAQILNTSGLIINKTPVVKYLTSYPEFSIFRTFPNNNWAGASLSELVICSNSPLLSPAKEDYESYFKANLDYEINYWGNSWKVTRYSDYYKCNVNEFSTILNYGLRPLSDYSLELKLEDVFGQKISLPLKFTTGQMPSSQLAFYHFQGAYNVTTPQRTKLTYAAKNMNYLNLEICKLGVLDFLYYMEQKPGFFEPPGYIANCQRISRDIIELPERYWLKNYFKIDLKDYFPEPIGHYILTFYHPNYREQWGQRRQIYERTYLTVTNLGVAEKKINAQYAAFGKNEPLTTEQLSELRNLYWVNNMENLEPVTGAEIKIYQQSKDKSGLLILAGAYTTNNQGISFSQVFPDLKAAIISKGNDSTIIPSRESKLDYTSQAFSAQKIYLYTDKPIYQPGQEVFLKGIYRLGYDGSYEIYNEKPINLKVFNSKNDEILTRDLEINDYGTFNTKIILEKGAPLGMYRACLKEFHCVHFDVQEYVPAPFEVEVKTDKEEYISKDTVNLEIQAQYYFGVPLEGGEATYTISSQNYYFDRYSDGYFDFGKRWYYYSPLPYGEKFLLRGKTSLDSRGKAKISQLFDFEKLFKDKEEKQSKIIVVDVTVKNPQGQSISSQKSFIVHSGEFYLGLRADKPFVSKDKPINIRVKTVDSQGEETKVKNITLNLYKIEWIYSKRLGTGGSYHYTWEKKRELVKKYQFNTDKQGNFVQELKIAKEGSYEAEAEVLDKRNNLIFSTLHLYVYGEGEVSIRPTKDTELEIETEKTDLAVGEEAKIIVKSPYKESKALITIERGKIFDYKIREIQGNLYNFNFPVKEDYLPNVFASVLLISSEPEVKFGQVEFKINTDQKELDIKVASNKKYYLPGEEVVLDFLVKDYRKEPVSAELSIAVVDLSVLALKGNPKKNPLIFFYDGFPLTVSTSSNLKNILIETIVPTKGGGGMAEEALARKKRGIFKETAFWSAIVRTDQNGRAQIKFILPDNLTTWQAETLGLTRDTKLGVNYQEFMTRKELMVVPLKPRFVVPGDTFYIGAKIFNQSKYKQKLDVKFDSLTLVLKDDKAEKKISLKPDETETIYFEVQAPENFESGEHRFILSAKSQQLEDRVEQSINITKNITYEVTATANYTSENVSWEYVFLPDNVVREKGNLSIKSSATLAVFLSDALNYLVGFSYGCTEQIASRLDAIAILERGLNLPNLADKFQLEKIKYEDREYSIGEIVEIGLAGIYNNQQGDGGFAYWPRGQSNFYLTLHIVDTLYNLSLAGFEINQNSLNRAADYLYQKITTDYELYKNKDTVILAAYTLFRLPNFSNRLILKEKIIRIVNDDLFLQDQISNSSLAYLANLLTQGFSPALKNKVFNILDNRIDIDARGAFLESRDNVIWQYYETPIKNTALYLKALTADKSKSPILDKVLRWILNSRAKDGAWGSTNNTLSVIESLTDFLKWKRETESNFTLELFINNKAEGTFDFNPETILDQFRKEVSLENLEFNKNNTIKLSKTNRNDLTNNLYYDLSLKYYLPADQIPPRDEGLSITREFYHLDDIENKNPLLKAKVGEVLRGHLQITIPKNRNFVIVEDYIPAGLEIVNLDLATEEKSLRLQERELKDREFLPDFKEIRDDRLFLYKENLGPGVYEFDYYVRALIRGRFLHLPALTSEMYFPENFGRTDGRYFEITQ